MIQNIVLMYVPFIYTHLMHVMGTHTCWWEGQSQAPTNREPLLYRDSAAAATGRKVRAARPFASDLVTFRKKQFVLLAPIYREVTNFNQVRPQTHRLILVTLGTEIL